jgi:hypothetical protein
MPDPAQVSWIHYIPLATTVVAVVFASTLIRRYRQRRVPHLWWWATGVVCYGIGTLTEALITVLGNTILLTKAWYVAGALLGGYPLAQGSLYLLASRRFANRMTSLSLPVVIVSSVLVFLSPAVPELLEPHRPSGAILAWRWIRLMTPFVNIYASIFLIGGAAWSSWRFFKTRAADSRGAGNALIALGAILPGIGGSIAKAGTVEALYVLEFVGLILIWTGERVCARRVPEMALGGRRYVTS